MGFDNRWVNQRGFLYQCIVEEMAILARSVQDWSCSSWILLLVILMTSPSLLIGFAIVTQFSFIVGLVIYFLSVYARKVWSQIDPQKIARDSLWAVVISIVLSALAALFGQPRASLEGGRNFTLEVGEPISIGALLPINCFNPRVFLEAGQTWPSGLDFYPDTWEVYGIPTKPQSATAYRNGHILCNDVVYLNMDTFIIRIVGTETNTTTPAPVNRNRDAWYRVLSIVLYYNAPLEVLTLMVGLIILTVAVCLCCAPRKNSHEEHSLFRREEDTQVEELLAEV